MRVAQPAVSRQIRKLEGELGVDLLVRAGTGLSLTDAGTLLLERSKLLIQQLEQTGHDVMAHADSPAGVVTIGVPSTAGTLIISAVLWDAQREFPRITLKVVEATGHVLTERLIGRQLSLGLIFDPVPNSELIAEPLLIERLHLFGEIGSRCSQSAPVTMSDLAGFPMVLPSYPHNVRVLLEDAAMEFGFRLNVAHEVDSVAVIRSLVRQGAGYGVLTAGSVLEDSMMVSRPIDSAGLSMTLSIVTRAELRQSPALKVAAMLMRRPTARLVAQGAWPGQPTYASSETGP